MLTDFKPVILLPTTDRESARTFFRDTLGLKLESEDDFAIVFDTGGIMLRVTPVKDFTPHQFSVLGWETPDIKRSVIELVAKGLEFEKYDFPWMQQDESRIWTAPDGTQVAWFKDPSGNLLSLSQHVERAD